MEQKTRDLYIAFSKSVCDALLAGNYIVVGGDRYITTISIDGLHFNIWRGNGADYLHGYPYSEDHNNFLMLLSRKEMVKAYNLLEERRKIYYEHNPKKD